jgi:hypothetical protein
MSGSRAKVPFALGIPTLQCPAWNEKNRNASKKFGKSCFMFMKFKLQLYIDHYLYSLDELMAFKCKFAVTQL